MVLVLGVIVLSSVAISMIQTSAYTEAVAGREALARVRAWWAARAGVEAAIAKLEYSTQNPDATDAYRELNDMASVATGALSESSYRVATWEGKKEVSGPADAHARLNVNVASRDDLLNIEPFMTEDIADAILDWIDADDDVRELGAEISYYQGLARPYEPRNAPMRSMQELELVAAVDVIDVRGEDWNLNGVLDPGEDDGDTSWPPDNHDGVLQAGWSGVLSTMSVEGTLGLSGEERLDLSSASDTDLISRTRVDRDQAKLILDYVDANSSAQITDFIGNSLAALGRAAGLQVPQGIQGLTREQLKSLVDECSVTAAGEGALKPGRINLNTAPRELFDSLVSVPSETWDSILSERDARPQGFASIIDLLDIPGISRQSLAQVAALVTTRSNVYVVTSRGLDHATGLEVEIRATIDRSSLPVVIQEIVIR
jgi:type II secretory pathway component PulK